MIKILVVGSGGREHAIAWKLADSPHIERIFVVPGNAGTAEEQKCVNIPIAATAISELVQFAKTESVTWTLVGPEMPLALGLVDHFEAAGLRCIGPSQKAAQLETSKVFAKDFLKRHQIPTAASEHFTDLEAALLYLKAQDMPIVIKADGLAAGKGVVIAQTRLEAIEVVNDFLGNKTLGTAGQKIVIEDFLEGQEVSFIVMTDGTHIIPFPSAQDHKTRDEGDKGPNTGGMGAYAPTVLVDAKLQDRILKTIMEPTLIGMRQEGMPYRGFLYAGLMITPQGEPKVLEFNCRLGDPETEPLMMLLDSDLVDLCEALLDHRLDKQEAHWKSQTALGVVMATQNYPGVYPKGAVITGLEQSSDESIKIFHAGTVLKNNQVVTAGGRVLCVTTLGNTIQEAQKKAYTRVHTISWPGAFWRRDIGFKAYALTNL